MIDDADLFPENRNDDAGEQLEDAVSVPGAQSQPDVDESRLTGWAIYDTRLLRFVSPVVWDADDLLDHDKRPSRTGRYRFRRV